ncbi:S-layer homology domain-containing protein [Planococcus shenhongbingii]|uniref:S-layer homology domain-containing protein n=1 Tax=Planococcus shenhongbingii TaxID=3058398 RepID=UPI002629F053|nr:S-layer homology domain-containing protein [Planococcus sp. N016]WKA57843.1 S-layer homology domain-containing protein [Planococcus sp. N016]
MKKVLLITVMAALVLSLFNSPIAKAADDLSGHPYEKEMRELMALGVITGYNDGSIQPERHVTRAEFAKMVIKTFGLGTNAESAEFKSAGLTNAGITATAINFKDISAHQWFYWPVMDAVQAGIVKGYPDNTFRPNESITREQMATMVSRALAAKGMLPDVEQTATLNFKDLSTILEDHVTDVRILSHLEILTGNTDGTFKPKESSKRWMVALVMLRAKDYMDGPAEKEFQAVSVASDKTTIVKHFDTFAEAKKYVQDNTNSQAVERTNKILWMEEGIGFTNAFTEIYPSETLKASTGTFRPYVPASTELKFLDSTGTTVKVELAGKIGYVSQNVIRLIPEQAKKGQSYYEVSTSGSLVHKIYNHSNGTLQSTGEIGKAPKEFVAGMKYYSWDGATFTNASGALVTEAHQYFNKLPLHTTSNYTAAELDKYLQDAFPYYNKTVAGKTWTKSPLVGTGKFFKEMESKYKVNALYLMAHAIHESGWGTSKIAQDKFNLFGYGAVDADPYKAAFTYLTFRESIEYAAQKVDANYHTIKASYYNGAYLGNKGGGMNVRYASDPFWGEKIAGHMYRADLKLGGKDLNKKILGETTTAPLNFRSGASATNEMLYTLPVAGVPVVINGNTTASGVAWHKVQPENKADTEAYVHGSYIKMLPLAK